MGIAIALALAFGLPASSVGDVPATETIPVTLSEKLVKYAIKGDTSHELYTQMAKVGPLDEASGKHYQGMTFWNTRWTFGMTSLADGRCGLDDIKIEVEVRMTLPEWHPNRHADPRLEQGWPGYLAALTGHEMGHRANAVKAAFGVRDVLATMPPTQDCQLLATAANTSAMAVISDYRKTDLEYDRQTDHGAKQGLRLP